MAARASNRSGDRDGDRWTRPCPFDGELLPIGAFGKTSVGPAAVPASVVRAVRDAGSARQSGPLRICILVLGGLSRRSHPSANNIPKTKIHQHTTYTPRTMGGYRARSGIAPQTSRRTDGGEAESHTHRSSTDTLHVSARSMWPALSPRSYRLFNGRVRPRAAPSRSRRETSEPHAMRACAMAPLAPCLRQID